MAARKTHPEYVADLRARFGANGCKVVGKYVDGNTAIDHECNSCKKIYKASPMQMLHYKQKATCNECSIRSRADGSALSKEEFEKKLRKKFKGKLKVAEYQSNHKKATFICNCGDSWLAKPYEIMKSKSGRCRACSFKRLGKKRRKTDSQFKKEMGARKDIRVLSRYKSSSDKIKVECTECRHVWEASSGNLLWNNTGCPVCCKRYGPKTYEIKVLGRKFQVQGYEGAAIKNMVARGCPVKSIHTFKSGKVPTVPYSLGGQKKEYWPDLRVGKTLYEVKSTYTLYTYWKKNVAKAKAAVKAGWKFKLYLVSEDETVVTLPSDWYEYKIEELQKYLRRKEIESVTVLSMDPGTSNHAWSVLKVSRPFKVEVLASGMIENTIKDLKGNMRDKIPAYLGEVNGLVEEYEATHIIMERYMARGMKGATIECVNVMIGAILGATWHELGIKSKNMMLIPAAQWKNEWNRRSSLELFYKKVNCVVHQVDSVGIGLYGAAHWLDEKPFETITRLEKQLAKMIDKTNLGKVIARRS